MSDERAELKPCPWLHEGSDLLEGSWPAKHQYWVHCPCGAMGPICDSPEKARERWNTRATPGWDAAIEEAAKVCEDAFGDAHPYDTAIAIRALKKGPSA